VQQVSALLGILSVEGESIALSPAAVHCWEIALILWWPAQEKFAIAAVEN
jgi:hypothetical protein